MLFFCKWLHWKQKNARLRLSSPTIGGYEEMVVSQVGSRTEGVGWEQMESSQTVRLTTILLLAHHLSKAPTRTGRAWCHSWEAGYTLDRSPVEEFIPLRNQLWFVCIRIVIIGCNLRGNASPQIFVSVSSSPDECYFKDSWTIHQFEDCTDGTHGYGCKCIYWVSAVHYRPEIITSWGGLRGWRSSQFTCEWAVEGNKG